LCVVPAANLVLLALARAPLVTAVGKPTLTAGILVAPALVTETALSSPIASVLTFASPLIMIASARVSLESARRWNLS
jgi:hypothetical protein